MVVPFLDLKAQYRIHRSEIDRALQRVVNDAAFAGGPYVKRFEDEFARFCGCDHAIGVGSGTEALWLTLQALGIGAGDEVVTVPNTFIATAEAISLCGAEPVFVDVRPTCFTLDPEQLHGTITERTKAVVPVHLFGQTANMDPILEIAQAHGLPVIEDACQAHGAGYRQRRAGSMGRAGCFSFYPGKNLGAYGEAGAVVTNDSALADRLRLLRDHGQNRKYQHQLIGANSRMDGLQAAVLSVKLQYLEQWNEARRKVARMYDQLLGGLPDIHIPTVEAYAEHVYHVYAIRSSRRDALAQHLRERGIGCNIHYPTPIHLQPAYAHLGLAEGAFPVAEKCSAQFLSLPMYPELSFEQIQAVAQGIESFPSTCC